MVSTVWCLLLRKKQKWALGISNSEKLSFGSVSFESESEKEFLNILFLFDCCTWKHCLVFSLLEREEKRFEDQVIVGSWFLYAFLSYSFERKRKRQRFEEEAIVGCFLGIKEQGSKFLRLKGWFFRSFLLAFIDAYFRKNSDFVFFFPFSFV